MKKALILLMITVASAASAQSPDPVQQAHRLLQSRHQALQSLLPSYTDLFKGAAPEERVIAASTYDSTGIVTDSALLTYSGKRGSAFDYLNLGYDFFLDPYTAYPLYNPDGGHFFSPQIYCDTTIHWMQQTSVLSLYEKTFSNYDVNNELISYVDLFHDTVNNTKYLNTFDSKNNIAASYLFYPDGTTWDSAGKRFFVYDVSSHLLVDSMFRKDSSGVWQPAVKDDYAYDSSGNVIETNTYEYLGPGAWFSLYGSIYTYNSTNQLLTAVAGIFGGYTIADTFAYSSGISYPTTFIEYNNFTGGDPQHTNRQYHLDASGTVDTCYIKNWDPWLGWVYQGGQMIAFSYDADNEPVLEKWYDYVDSSYSSIPSTTEHYYYESLQSTNIQKIAVQGFSIYPNPTANDLFITRKDNSNNNTGSLVISIINATGQKMIMEAFSSFNNTETVSLSGFTPGTYWLLIQDGNGNVLHCQSIVKQ